MFFSEEKFDVITIGSATKDIFLNVEAEGVQKLDNFKTGEAICFGLGSKIQINKINFTSGGGGTNQAVTYARQGYKTACVGVVGQDFNGTEILEELKKENIDTSFFQVHSDDHTAYSVILVSRGGERTILSYKGEGQHLDVNQIPFEKMNSKWVSLDSLGGRFDVLEGIVRWANEKRVKIAANPGNKELEHGLEKLRPMLKNFSIVIMNKEEASNLTGVSYQKEEDIFKFMDEIVDGIFVMTKGNEGVSVSDGKNIYSAGVPDSPVIERTGAGDAFTAGFVSEFIRSEDISKSIQFATANASSVVMFPGGKEGVLRKDDPGKFPLIDVDIKQIK